MRPGHRSELRLAGVLLMPALAALAVFQYVPMYGLTIAFREFSWRAPFRGPSAGMVHFSRLLQDPAFVRAVGNTVVYALAAGTLMAMGALVVAGVFHLKGTSNGKPSFSTLVMAPSFLSWVVVGLIVTRLLAFRGPVNRLLVATNLSATELPFLTTAGLFGAVFVMTAVWKHAGMLAFVIWTLLQQSESSIRDAAAIDGLGQVGTFLRIELGMLRPQVVALTLLFMLLLFDSMGEQALSIGTAAVRSSADVIESYGYRIGVQRGRWPLAVAGSVVSAVIRVPIAALLLIFQHRVRGHEGDSR